MTLRTILEGVGILALLVTWFYMKQVEKSRDTMLQKVGFLADHLDAQVTLSENLIREVRRMKDGRIVTKTRFVPPESRIDVSIPKNGEKPTISFDNKGFTFRPGISLGYVNGLKVGMSTKVFFWGRYGVVLGVNSRGMSAGVSRYVDDIVPFWRPKNLEIFGAYKALTFDGTSGKLDLGIRLSL